MHIYKLGNTRNVDYHNFFFFFKKWFKSTDKLQPGGLDSS